MLVSWLASRFAHNAESISTQYLALAGFVVAEGLIFLPMLFIAQAYAPGTIQSAATVTLFAFTGAHRPGLVHQDGFLFFGCASQMGAGSWRLR